MTERDAVPVAAGGEGRFRRYRVIAQGRSRRFEISGGLRQGYHGETGDIGEVVAAHHAWQRETGAVFGVVIQAATISYGWPEDGCVRTDSEAGFVLSGTINVLYQADQDDGVCYARLRALAVFLASWLKQRRIYLVFGDFAEIMEESDDH